MDNSEEAEGACRLCSQQFGADDRALRLLLVRKFSVSCTVKQNTSGSLRFANSRHLPASGCPCWKLYGSHQGEAGLYRLQCLLLCFEGLLQWREAARAFHCTYHPRHGERKASCLQLDASRLTKNFNPDSAWDFCSHTLVVRRVAPSCFSHSPLWRLRFDKLRKEKTAERCAFPSRKPKHEKCDIKQLIRRAEEEYVDFQEAGCQVAVFAGDWTGLRVGSVCQFDVRLKISQGITFRMCVMCSLRLPKWLLPSVLRRSTSWSACESSAPASSTIPSS